MRPLLEIWCFGTNIPFQLFAKIYESGADRINLVRFFFSIYTIIFLFDQFYYLKSSTFLMNI